MVEQGAWMTQGPLSPPRTFRASPSLPLFCVLEGLRPQGRAQGPDGRREADGARAQRAAHPAAGGLPLLRGPGGRIPGRARAVPVA
eukprot:255248-Chlamydomonas_euryale.AAC.5